MCYACFRQSVSLPFRALTHPHILEVANYAPHPGSIASRTATRTSIPWPTKQIQPFRAPKTPHVRLHALKHSLRGKATARAACLRSACE